MHPLRILLLLSMVLLYSANALGQCEDGSEPECTCETAPVLCTVDELDGYMFSMSDYQHPDDGPEPICPQSPFSETNNPTWFAFTAWCTELTLDVMFDNCVANGGFIGVQVAIYSDCTFNDVVACNADVSDCDTDDKTLSMTGLTIGDVYYFMVDGCGGAYCDVTIDVVGVCGEEEIEPWTEPVEGETEVCGGNTETYTVQDLAGAADFHWFIDGVEDGTTSDPTYDITWDTEGTFELCIDASNDPCVPIDDPPEPICITINVYAPDAGDLVVTPTTLCPGETVDFSVSGYNTNPEYTTELVVTDDSGVIIEVISPDSGTFTSDECGTFTICSYNYITATGTPPVVGENINDIDCADECCDLVCEDVSFEDNETPTFPNPPEDITYTCFDQVPVMEDLEWFDNCDGSGFVPGTETGSADLCNGGTLTRDWEYTDACGNIGFHTQTIEIDAPLEPAFIDPPQDMTVSCEDAPTSAPDLEYTNNGSGDCLFEGFVSPTQSGTADACGGTIIFTWEYTDPCSNTITHTQTFTVDPAPEPTFINPPQDMTVSCENMPTGATDLEYTNNAAGACLIEGMVIPSEAGSADECGGEITYRWEFTDPCGTLIFHIQTITVDPAPEPSFVDPPADMTVSCENIPSSAPDLSYTNGSSGACLIEGSVAAVQSGDGDECGGEIVFTWDLEDPCGTNINHVQTITIDPAPLPEFINPPGDMTVSCDAAPTSAPDLDYTNNGNGSCLYEGSVPAVMSGGADECGGQISFTWEYTDPCSNTITHVQNFTVDPAPDPSFTDPPADVTVSCSDFPQNIPQLDYDNGGSGDCSVAGSVDGIQIGEVNPCGGPITFEWEYTSCSTTISYSQSLEVDPAEPAEFVDPPADVTVDCDEFPSSPPDLEYDNNEGGNCSISGFAPGTQLGDITACGGMVQFVWNFVDECGREIEYTQNLEVEEAPPAVFLSPPADMTLSCEEVGGGPGSLNYDNSRSGICEISGSVPGTQSGSFDECGGELIYSWEFTDECGRTIIHDQTITITRSDDPVFVNPPADVTLECGLDFPDASDLDYTNGSLGACEISGTVTATVNINGTTGEYIWEFTDPCSNEIIQHIQIINIRPQVDIVIMPDQGVICQGDPYDLSTIVVDDLNDTDPDISFHTSLPPDNANEVTNLVVNPSVTTIYYVYAINEFDCFDTEEFLLEVDDPVYAGDDGEAILCEGAFSVNLFSYLNGVTDFDGEWVDVDGTGVNLSNPSNVNFNTVPLGTYQFDYYLEGTDVCPNDSSVLIVNIVENPEFIIDSIFCVPGGQHYTVILITDADNQVAPNGGNMTQVGDTFTIADIPILNDVWISITNPETFCFAVAILNPPDCSCPTVNPPESNGDFAICFGDSIPTLSVTTEPDALANWYDAPTGGNLLLANSNEYTPDVTDPGTHIFYVEAESTIDIGCVSNIRVAVTLIIFDEVLAEEVEYEICDTDTDGFAIFDLASIIILINSSPDVNIQFFNSLDDAENDENQLDLLYENELPYSQIIYARVESMNGCFTIAEVQLTVHDLPIFDLTVVSDECLGDDQSGVTIHYLGQEDDVFYSIDSLSLTSDSTFNPLEPGTHMAFVSSAFGCIDSLEFEVATPLELSLVEFSSVCSNNGTESDSNDDFYTIYFELANSLDNSAQFTLYVDSDSVGVYQYGMLDSIILAADGAMVTIQFNDNNSPCLLSEEIGPLFPCSTDCNLQVLDIDFECFDNMTTSDPGDDYYEYTVVVTALNGDPDSVFYVLNGVDTIAQGSYLDTLSLSFPADGSSFSILLIDGSDNSCANTIDIGPLVSCSNTCDINASLSNVSCDNNGTQNDSNDDFFFVDVLVDGLNTGIGWTIDSLGINGDYGVAQTLGPFQIADGSFVITIMDSDSSDCLTDILITPPAPCSEPCEIEILNLVASPCNDNGTGNTSADDFFDLSLEVNTILGNTTSFEIEIDGIVYGPFNYDEIINIPGLGATGNNLVINVYDVSNGACRISENVSVSPCSSCDQTIDAGSNLLLSCNVPQVMLEATVSEPGSYTWSGPQNYMSDELNPNVDLPGTYYLEVLFPDGCISQDSVEINLDGDIPIADAGEGGLLNCVSDTLLLSGILSSQSEGLIYEWLGEDGELISNELEFYIDSSGTYYLQVIDTISGCTSALDSVFVDENFNQPIAIIYAVPSDVLDCYIHQIQLTYEEQINVKYLWHVESVILELNELLITEPGTITLEIIDTISGCGDMSVLEITDLELYPFVNIETPDTITCLDTEISIDASGSQMGDDLIYTWYDSLGNVINNPDFTLMVDAPGWYYFEAIDTVNGCTNIDSVLVGYNLSDPTVTSGDDIVLNCDSTFAQLGISITGDPLDYEINWSAESGGTILSSNNQANIDVEGPGVFIVEVINSKNGCSTLDTIRVDNNPNVPELALLDIDSIACFGMDNGSINISDIIGGEEPYEVYVNGILADFENINLSPGDYHLEIIDANGCSIDTTVSLQEGIFIELFLEPELELNFGENGILQALLNLDSTLLSFIEWTPPDFLSCDSCLTTIVEGIVEGTYTITVMTEDGCIATATIRILILKEENIYVPNVFSPNNDGINEYFTLYADQSVENILSLHIFDRWGELVFVNEDFLPNQAELGWDGEFRETGVVDGVYAYVFELQMIDGSIKIIGGDVTVMR